MISSFSPSQDGMVALNFAFEDEAETFLQVAATTVASRNRRREGKFQTEKKKKSSHHTQIIRFFRLHSSREM